MDFAEEALKIMANRNIVELLRMENGWLAVCLKSCKQRTKQIKKGRQRYKTEEDAINKTISYLDRCWKKSL